MEPRNPLTGSSHYDVHHDERRVRIAVIAGCVAAVVVAAVALWMLAAAAAGPAALAVVGNS